MNKRPPKNGEVVKKIQNTLLIDGSALFKTSFFGAKNSYNNNGQHIGGIYQFITILRMLLSEDVYHRVYVFWDGNFSGKLRYDIYKPYKSDRGKDYINGTKPIDESELLQREVVWEYLNEMYIRQLKDDIIEGDDFIAYYCLNKKENEKITIATNDRDMAQLVKEKIKIYFLDLKKYVGIDNFSSYFCYHRDNAVLMKTIIGDNSDSIKGIKGVGEKTLIKLFPEITNRKFSIEELLVEAKILSDERVLTKKKPLLALENLLYSITDGVQGTKVYEINKQLVDLSSPMMTNKGIANLETLIEGTLDDSGRELKNVLSFMKRDGLDIVIGEYRYPDYLVPFKNLIAREKIKF